MKVILLTDISKIGKKYEIKDFKDGYAENVLLSKGLAELATPMALQKLESKMKKLNEEKFQEEKRFAELINEVSDKRIIIKAKANEKGHLFKQISALDVVNAIKENAGVDIELDMIHVDGHIKQIGKYAVGIKKGNREGKCELEVVAL